MSSDGERAPVGPLRSLLKRLVDPSEDWAQRAEERKPSALMVYSAVLLVILVLMAYLATRIGGATEASRGLVAGIWIAAGFGAAVVVLLSMQIRRHFLDPLAHLYNWALGMCDGDLSSRISPRQTGRFAKLTFHINRLSEALEKLANEMDDVVWQQTRRLQERNKALEMLFEVASAINAAASLNELLERSATIVMPIVNATGAVVRLRGPDGAISEIGAFPDDVADAPAVRSAAQAGDALLDGRRREQRIEIHGGAGDDDATCVVSVPLHYQGRTLGLLGFTTRTPEVADDEEVLKLLSSAGKQLGMAIAKSRLDEESHNLTLMRERTSLAHELHDSLAQSLAGLRFQAKLLGDTLDGDDALQARRELKRVNASLDGLNAELRELIANFRAPMDERGLIPPLEDLVTRFARASGISTHLHTECRRLKLPAAAEMQVLGIVREALANARKHSQANTVRVLVRCRGDEYSLLVEDDGVGSATPAEPADDPAEHPGEHVGLLIMEERARRLGGTLRIESEAGEGTRVELRFSAASEAPETPETPESEVHAGVR